MPLSAYQGFDLSNSQSIDSFIKKLLAMSKTPFDEEMTKPIREFCSRKLGAYSDSLKEAAGASQPGGGSELETLRNYLDARFANLYKLVPVSTRPKLQWTVRIQFRPKGRKQKVFSINIDDNSSFQNLLDECYFRMDSYVRPFQYLVEWVIEEVETQRLLVVREIQDRVPAADVLSQHLTYRD